MQNTVATSDVSTIPTSNIIKFPIENRNFASTTALEELMEQATKNKIEFVSFMSSEILEELFFKLSIMGFHFDDEIYLKDLVFVGEALKSLMLKTMGIEHGMQLAAEKLVDIADIPEYDEDEED